MAKSKRFCRKWSKRIVHGFCRCPDKKKRAVGSALDCIKTNVIPSGRSSHRNPHSKNICFSRFYDLLRTILEERIVTSAGNGTPESGIQNILNAIQMGILTKSTKSQLEEPESSKKDLEMFVAPSKRERLPPNVT